MENIDVINIAGLLMSGKDDGIEIELRQKSSFRSVKTIAPTDFLSVITESPRDAIEKCIRQIRVLTKDLQAVFDTPNILLIGRSYGAFMAFQSVIRAKLSNIIGLVLIEGPLNPDIDVKVPTLPLLKVLVAARRHYHERAQLMKEIINIPEKLQNIRAVIVQGTARDSVVPNNAQVISDNHQAREISTKTEIESILNEISRGPIILRLPTELGGIADGKAKLFPQDYRNHLFWSKEKMAIIRKIIEATAKTGFL